jgi:hypothetical protein
MQRVNIYNDLLHLTGEWMNAEFLLQRKITEITSVIVVSH